MDYRTLEITWGSAKDLKQVCLFSKMAVYAVVSISSDRRSRHCPPPDLRGGRNPSWSITLRLVVPPDGGHSLHILLRTERGCPFCDRDAGEVRVPLADPFDGEGIEGRWSVRHINYQVFPVSESVAAPAPHPITDFAYPPPATEYPSALDDHGTRPRYLDSG